MEQGIYTAGNVLLIIAGVIGTASVIVHTRVRWRDSPMGRHLMAYMAVAALVLDLGIVRVFFAETPWFLLLRTVVFAGLPVVMGQQLLLQIRAQRDDRARRDKAQP